MSARFNRSYFAERYVAQETRKSARGGDFDYAMSDGAGRFTSAASINTDTPARGASGCSSSVASHGGSACGVKADSEARSGAPDPVAAPTERRREQHHGRQLKAPAGGESPSSAGHARERIGESDRPLQNDEGQGGVAPNVGSGHHNAAKFALSDGLTTRPDIVAPHRGTMDNRVAPQLTLLDLRRLAFELPMPLSVNAAWRSPQRKEILKGMDPGTKFLTDEHRRYRTLVISLVRREMLRAELREQPLLGRVELLVKLYFADARRCDIDNRIKPLQDALTHAHAYQDDSQIDRLVVERIIEPRARERCEVTLQEIAA